MTHAIMHGKINYWIVDRRFADLEPELTRILQPLPEVRVLIDRRIRERSPEWTAYSEVLGVWSLLEDGRQEQYWVVNQRFAELEQKLTRILQPLPEVRVLIDRRVRDRSPEWTAHSELRGAWSLPEEGAKKQYSIVHRRFADLEPELTRILQPLPEVQVIIDRRIRERPQERTAYSKVLGVWSLSEDAGRKQDQP
ncbi:MAG: hypothetical protein ACE5K9_03470 [Candidatus Methylomirabilales bacterium]